MANTTIDNFTVKAVIRAKRIKKNGKTPVLIRVKLGKTNKYYPAGMEIEPKRFNLETGLLVQKYTGANIVNTELINRINEIERFLTKSDNRSFYKLDAFLIGKESITFNDFAKEFLKAHALRYSKGYIKGLQTSLNAFNSFAPNIRLKDIDKLLLTKYKNHLLENISPNTVHNRFKFLKLVLKSADENEVFVNRLHEFVIKQVKTKREFLESNELYKIELYMNKSTTPIKGRRVALWFLIACETGLRYGDLSKNINNIINKKEIPDNVLFHYAEKTGSANPIPLSQKAKDLLQLLLEPDFCVNMYSLTNYNAYLKAMAIVCGIDKRITTHTARHTCATLLLEQNVPIEAISGLLGHTSLKTTQIYMKIRNKYLEAEISKLDERRTSIDKL